MTNYKSINQIIKEFNVDDCLAESMTKDNIWQKFSIQLPTEIFNKQVKILFTTDNWDYPIQGLYTHLNTDLRNCLSEYDEINNEYTEWTKSIPIYWLKILQSSDEQNEFDIFEAKIIENKIEKQKTDIEKNKNSTKKLELELVMLINCRAIFRIKNQTHQNENFGEYKNSFIAKNGIILKSLRYPELIDDILCVRGSDSVNDNFDISVPYSKIGNILEAIQEYNEYFL